MLIEKKKYDRVYAENIQLKKKLEKYENNTACKKQEKEINYLKHKYVKTGNSWENKYNKLKRSVDHERYLYNRRLNDFWAVEISKYFQLLINLKKSYFLVERHFILPILQEIILYDFQGLWGREFTLINFIYKANSSVAFWMILVSILDIWFWTPMISAFVMIEFNFLIEPPAQLQALIRAESENILGSALTLSNWVLHNL